MARDRKRAKQRRGRRARETARGAAPSQPTRADLPGALEHASGDVDEFDAALVRGARGVAVPDSVPEVAPRRGAEEDREDEASPVGATPEAQAPPPSTSLGDGVAEQRDAQAERQLSRGGADGGGRDVAPAAGEVPRERPEGIQRGFSRVVAFLRASWAELQRVQWPDRRQVAQATAVVLGFVAIAGLYLGAADFVAKEIVDAIL